MIVDRCRDIEEFKRVHSQCENDRIPTAESILRCWDYHFCFYDEDTNKLVGCIYIEEDEGKTCLSGFSIKKNYYNVIDAINWVSEFMRKDDLYSHTTKKCAKIVLLRCGFKKINDEWFVRKAY